MGKVTTLKPRKDKGPKAPPRPMPPADLEPGMSRIVPAPELKQWAIDTFISQDGPLYNPAHKHLDGADVEFLWASEGFVKAGLQVMGQAESVMFRAGGWQKARQVQQFMDWFGHVPLFIVTIDANVWREADPATSCALIEHELFHIAHAKDDMGNPAFTRDGDPKLALRGHDVEEFTGVVQRYGAYKPGLKEFAQAVLSRPQIDEARLLYVCGTCIKRAA